MSRRKRFCELFRFREDIRSQSSKITCPRSQRLRRHSNFSLDTNIFIFLNYCYWVCKLRWNGVSVAVDHADIISALALTSLTRYQCSPWLRGWTHIFREYVRATAFAPSYGAEVEFTCIDKKVSKILWHCLFKGTGSRSEGCSYKNANPHTYCTVE